ncbi:aspartate beta-hydroxylase domain-containing protein 2 isoform X2 [Trichomycterus rosablanca]|uniref:aspartate beta-hydroxylase domain-containing protein 2 isoform X2 n=1 Tax=Trichomycterus rosablanca TaxID=2290929 RepID=UPI002F35AA6C
MPWSLDLLPLPPCVDLGGPPLSGLLWTLLLLFLWYCYRVGSEPSSCSANSSCSTVAHPPSCSSAGPGCSPPKAFPTIAVEEEKKNEVKSYLTPVWSHAPFPTQVAAGSRKLYTALQEYAKRYSWAGMGRIHKGLRIQARINDRLSIQKPHLFYLPDVPSIPYFPRDAHRHDIDTLEASYPIILAEFQAVFQKGVDTKLGWTYQGPKGQAVFPLYNAGVRVASNCRACPCTYRILLSLRTFISSNSLGAAGFWLLGPGASLGGTYGPTNTRLRCHLENCCHPLISQVFRHQQGVSWWLVVNHSAGLRDTAF